jgi:hypothetical protein
MGMSNKEPGEGGAVGIYRFRCCDRCGGQPNQHPVRHIEHGTHSACVDVEIADLVLACWQAGIATSESCQSHGKRSGARLVFLSMPITAAERFANALLHTGDTALYWRMFDPTTPDRWPAPSVTGGLRRYQPGSEICLAFRVSWIFPSTEVPLLISRLRAWNMSHERELPAEPHGPQDRRWAGGDAEPVGAVTRRQESERDPTVEQELESDSVSTWPRWQQPHRGSHGELDRQPERDDPGLDIDF